MPTGLPRVTLTTRFWRLAARIQHSSPFQSLAGKLRGTTLLPHFGYATLGQASKPSIEVFKPIPTNAQMSATGTGSSMTKRSPQLQALQNQDKNEVIVGFQEDLLKALLVGRKKPEDWGPIEDVKEAISKLRNHEILKELAKQVYDKLWPAATEPEEKTIDVPSDVEFVVGEELKPEIAPSIEFDPEQRLLPLIMPTGDYAITFYARLKRSGYVPNGEHEIKWISACLEQTLKEAEGTKNFGLRQLVEDEAKRMGVTLPSATLLEQAAPEEPAIDFFDQVEETLKPTSTNLDQIFKDEQKQPDHEIAKLLDFSSRDPEDALDEKAYSIVPAAPIIPDSFMIDWGEGRTGQVDIPAYLPPVEPVTPPPAVAPAPVAVTAEPPLAILNNRLADLNTNKKTVEDTLQRTREELAGKQNIIQAAQETIGAQQRVIEEATRRFVLAKEAVAKQANELDIDNEAKVVVPADLDALRAEKKEAARLIAEAEKALKENQTAADQLAATVKELEGKHLQITGDLTALLAEAREVADNYAALVAAIGNALN